MGHRIRRTGIRSHTLRLAHRGGDSWNPQRSGGGAYCPATYAVQPHRHPGRLLPCDRRSGDRHEPNCATRQQPHVLRHPCLRRAALRPRSNTSAPREIWRNHVGAGTGLMVAALAVGGRCMPGTRMWRQVERPVFRGGVRLVDGPVGRRKSANDRRENAVSRDDRARRDPGIPVNRWCCSCCLCGDVDGLVPIKRRLGPYLGGGRHVTVQLDTRAVAQPLALPRRSLEFPYRT